MTQKPANHNSFPWVHHYVKFGLFALVLVGIPLIASIIVILNSIQDPAWLVCDSVCSDSFTSSQNTGTGSFALLKMTGDLMWLFFYKLIVWLAFIYVFFGFVVSFISYFSIFSFQVYSSQIGNFFRLPKNKRLFYKMNLPVGFEYDTSLLGRFMRDLYNGFIINGMTWSSTLRSGKYHQTIGFDYIVENGRLEYYVSFPFNKHSIVIETFKKYLPQINLQLAKDPFADLPNQWSEDQNFKYEQMAGCVISHNMSEIYGATSADHNSGNKHNISDFLVYLGTALPHNKFVLQYIYTFDSLIDPSYYDKKYDELATNLMNKYSPSNAKKTIDTDAFTTLIPKYQVQKLNDINFRLNDDQGNLVRAGIKIVGFCSNEDYAKTERALDKAIRAYFQENSSYGTDNKLEKAYLTSTNQTYFNHHKVYMDLDEKARFAFDRYTFLPTILEPYFASLYNKFFYPNENRWRRRNLYVSFKRRLGYKPWSDSFCLLETNSIDRYFQIPIVRTKAESNIIVKN
jgi:hypothetical protein